MKKQANNMKMLFAHLLLTFCKGKQIRRWTGFFSMFQMVLTSCATAVFYSVNKLKWCWTVIYRHYVWCWASVHCHLENKNTVIFMLFWAFYEIVFISPQHS